MLNRASRMQLLSYEVLVAKQTTLHVGHPQEETFPASPLEAVGLHAD